SYDGAYVTFAAGEGSPLRCAELCRSQNYLWCKAFAYQIDASRCWLKTIVPPVVPNGNVVMGTGPDRAFEYGVDRPGGDLRNLQTGNAAACANVCAMDTTCKAFVWGSTSLTCWLKSEVTAPIASPDNTSGLRGGVMPGIALTGKVAFTFAVTTPAWPAQYSNS